MSKLSFDADRNLLTLGGERVVFHCHHYNVFLQRSLEEMFGSGAIEMQVDAAAESARRMLEPLFADVSGFQARLELASQVFSSNGFGAADLSQLGEHGGRVTLQTSHYAVGWTAKFGPATSPVSHFATGFWRGALVAAAGHAPERVVARQVKCRAMGDDVCEIEVEVR